MSIGVFTDKAHPPTIEQVRAAVQPKWPAWEELTRFIREMYTVREEYKFYGKNYGWACRFRKGGTALVSLYPTQGSFAVQIILGEADTCKALNLKLGKRVRQIIEQAHPYPEGRWLFIPIKSQRDLMDAQQLVMLKGGTRRRLE